MGKYIYRCDKESSLSDGLFSKTRQSVLSLLYGKADSAFYTKQILDAVKIGRGTVQRELKNLTDAGIIVREERGNQVYYQVNEKCPIADELKNIVLKTFGMTDVLKKALASKAKEIAAAFIFGSIASKSEDRASDIDVMIIGDVSFGEVVDLFSAAEKTLRREINPVVYPADEFKQKVKSDHHFVNSVIEGEKIFLIGDESELKRLSK